MWNGFDNCWVWSWKAEWAPCWQLTREYHRELQADAAALTWTAPNHITWIFSKKRQCFSLCTTFFGLVNLVFRNVYGGIHISEGNACCKPEFTKQSTEGIFSFPFGRKKPNNHFIRDEIETTNSVHLEELELAPFLDHSEPDFQPWIAYLHFWSTLASSWGWRVVASIWKICCTGYLHVAYWAL